LSWTASYVRCASVAMIDNNAGNQLFQLAAFIELSWMGNTTELDTARLKKTRKEQREGIPYLMNNTTYRTQVNGSAQRSAKPRPVQDSRLQDRRPRTRWTDDDRRGETAAPTDPASRRALRVFPLLSSRLLPEHMKQQLPKSSLVCLHIRTRGWLGFRRRFPPLQERLGGGKPGMDVNMAPRTRCEASGT